MANPLLKDVRILDLTRLLPGPFCTQYLAQLGAEVIKIEEPNGGDYARDLSAELFALVNRGKRSITLDLRLEEDQKRFKQLVEGADMVVESFRPGVMDKLGCSYETLKAINPRLVYAALTGYGQDGPYRDVAGHDLNYLAYAGALDQIGCAGDAPAISNLQIADLAGGALTAAVAMLAALHGARASGEGTFVDAAMLDGSLALQTMALAGLNTHRQTQPRGKDMLTGALPNYQVYKCLDGKYLAVGSLEPKFFANLITALGELTPLPTVLSKFAPSKKSKKPGEKSSKKADKSSSQKSAQSSGQSKAPSGMAARLQATLENPVLARRWLTPVRWALAGVFKLRSRDQWMRLLGEADACVAPVLTLEEALQNEQVRAREMVERTRGKPAFACPVRFNGEARAPLADSPELGADNASILR